MLERFYHLLAENDEITYEAYVSEQNLVVDDPNEPVRHPLVGHPKLLFQVMPLPSDLLKMVLKLLQHSQPLSQDTP